MSLSDSLCSLRLLIDELHEIDFGYPLGELSVAPPLSDARIDAELKRIRCEGQEDQVRKLYQHCNGITLANVHNGYFLNALERLRPLDRPSDPHTVLMNEKHSVPVLSIGSTGGGDLFVLDIKAGSVLQLPPSRIRNGVYEEHDLDVRVVGDCLEEFVDRIVSDTNAFVNDDSTHDYMA